MAGARAIEDETATLPGQHSATVEHQVLAGADEQTPAQIRAATKKPGRAAGPDTAAKRAAKARKIRRVDYTPAPDAMAWTSAYLPAETAAAIWAIMTGTSERPAPPVMTAAPTSAAPTRSPTCS